MTPMVQTLLSLARASDTQQAQCHWGPLVTGMENCVFGAAKVCFSGLDHFYLLRFVNCTLERMKKPVRVPALSLI